MNNQFRYVDAKYVCRMLGICRTKWWYLTTPGHRYCDEKAPRGFLMGKRSHRWRLEDVIEWAQSNNLPWGTN